MVVNYPLIWFCSSHSTRRHLIVSVWSRSFPFSKQSRTEEEKHLSSPPLRFRESMNRKGLFSPQSPVLCPEQKFKWKHPQQMAIQSLLECIRWRAAHCLFQWLAPLALLGTLSDKYLAAMRRRRNSRGWPVPSMLPKSGDILASPSRSHFGGCFLVEATVQSWKVYLGGSQQTVF